MGTLVFLKCSNCLNALCRVFRHIRDGTERASAEMCGPLEFFALANTATGLRFLADFVFFSLYENAYENAWECCNVGATKLPLLSPLPVMARPLASVQAGPALFILVALTQIICALSRYDFTILCLALQRGSPTERRRH